ncbi:C1 family peptidase [Phormidesmis sp. 146-35]
MTKKGTGWIPDYPDVKDYTLETDEIQGVVSRVRREQVTSAIEDITIKFTEALRLLAPEQSKNELTKLTDEIEKRVLGEVSFKVARIHKVLKLGMVEPEVLLIKNYLQRISQKSQGLEITIEYKSETVTDALFDQDAESAIRAFQASQKNLVEDGDGDGDGVVDIDTMIALREVVDALEGGNDRLHSLIQKWAQLSEDQPKTVIELLGEDRSNYFKHLSRLIAINQLSREWNEINYLTNHLTIYYLKGLTSSFIGKVLSHVPQWQVKKDELTNNLPQFFKELKTTFDHLDLKKPLEEPSEGYLYPPSKPEESSKHSAIDEYLKSLNERNESFKKRESLFNLLTYLSKSSEKKELDSSEALVRRQKVIQLIQSQSEEQSEKQIIEKYFEDNQATYNKENAAFQSVMQQLTQVLFPVMPPKAERREQAISAPLPPQVFEFVSKKLIDLKVYKKIHSEDLEKLYQVIRPIAEAIAQIISPLGKQSNLQIALERGFKTFEREINQAQSSSDQQTRLVSLAPIVPSERTAPIVPSERTRLQEVISEAVQQVLEGISSHSSSPQTGSSDRESTAEYTSEPTDPTNQTALYATPQNATPQKLKSIADLKTKLNEYIESGKLNHDKNPKSFEYCVSKPKKKLLEIIDLKPEQKGSEYLQVPLTRQLKQEIEKRQLPGDNIPLDRPSEEDKKVYLFLPEFVDLSFWCSEIEDQGSLNSCTAHAGVALTEYFAKRSFDRYVDVSPLFLYKVTRDLMHRQGDAGASVRETMKAMVLFGVPPEEYWSYPEHSADEDPSPFCYSFAQTYQALKYFRLDYAGISKYALLTQIQITLVAGFPCMFGFTIYSSIYSDVNMRKGYIPYPGKADKVEGGHAVVAVGYDDSKIIENADGRQSIGALLIRNSWGTAWGEGGYGWLPYDYVSDGLTADWWSLVRSEWFETGQFGVGASDLGDTRPGQK